MPTTPFEWAEYKGSYNKSIMEDDDVQFHWCMVYGVCYLLISMMNTLKKLSSVEYIPSAHIAQSIDLLSLHGYNL